MESVSFFEFIMTKGFKRLDGEFVFLDKPVKGFVGMMPKSVVNVELSSGNVCQYMFAEKIDGYRVMVYVTSSNIYVVDRGDTIFYLPCVNEFGGTQFDTEFIDGKFVVVDLPFLKGNKMHIFQQRYAGMRMNVSKFKYLPMEVQVFRGLHMLSSQPKEGLIIIESQGHYGVGSNSTVYKWKNVPTIDLSVTDNVAFTSDGVPIGSVKESKGVYEYNLYGVMICKRDKQANHSITVFDAVRESKVTFSVLMAKLSRDAPVAHYNDEECLKLLSVYFPKMIEPDVVDQDVYKIPIDVDVSNEVGVVSTNSFTRPSEVSVVFMPPIEVEFLSPKRIINIYGIDPFGMSFDDYLTLEVIDFESSECPVYDDLDSCEEDVDEEAYDYKEIVNDYGSKYSSKSKYVKTKYVLKKRESSPKSPKKMAYVKKAVDVPSVVIDKLDVVSSEVQKIEDVVPVTNDLVFTVLSVESKPVEEKNFVSFSFSSPESIGFDVVTIDSDKLVIARRRIVKTRKKSRKNVSRAAPSLLLPDIDEKEADVVIKKEGDVAPAFSGD